MFPAAFTYWLVSLLAVPGLDDTFCVEANRRPFCGPPQWVQGAGYVTVDRGAGGGAMPRHVRLIRGKEVLVVNPRKIRGHPELDVQLQPGDIIQVPPSFF